MRPSFARTSFRRTPAECQRLARWRSARDNDRAWPAPPAFRSLPAPPRSRRRSSASEGPSSRQFEAIDAALGFERRSSAPPPDAFDFAGWGKVETLDDLAPEASELAKMRLAARHELGVWSSTAICGNDITSSCLYVSALTAAQAGALAPVALGVVALVLFFFRKIYAEVGSALPLNGGTYTVLLNTTNKRLAASAAILTLLSYVATAVISAGEAMHYAHNLWHGLPVFGATIGLLGVFALLNVVGIAESAAVAIGIFFFHMATLTLLAVACTIQLARDPSVFVENWSSLRAFDAHAFVRALFFGFAAAMLGISGFESSANFIEEQKTGVFPKTLRNMWIAVTVFNPVISVLSMAMLPLVVIQAVPEDLLAQMGKKSAGAWLAMMVSVDAVLVLSGAVLTSFVGVTGLVRRMTLDRCLPQFLLAQNARRGTNHWIIFGFFALCCSILLATRGKVTTLAAVYSISFLSVMAFFALGNALLKIRRERLPREVRAGWPTVTFALGAVLLGIVGQIFLDPQGVSVFFSYFLVFGAAVLIMFVRVHLLRGALFVAQSFLVTVTTASERIRTRIHAKVDDISGRVVVYFTRGDDIALLNRAALYVMENEQTKHLKVVHVYNELQGIAPRLAQHLHVVDRLYPQLRIDLVTVKGKFGPELIELLSRRLNVPKNYMFIGTPGDRFPYRIEKLGGVRVIL
jgi:amino acid transporter